MSIKNFFILNMLVNGFLGVSALIFPDWLLSLHGFEAGDAATYMSHILGAALLGLAVVSWYGSQSGSAETRRTLAYGFIVMYLLGFVITLMDQLAGLPNTFGWSSVILLLFGAVVFGYFGIIKPE